MRWTCQLLLLVVLLGANSPTDWLRRGQSAYERGDYAKAIEAYDRAETGAGDPGLVAFNRAAASYQLGLYAEAELDYQRALEDARQVRLVRALYGKGNALALQGNSRRGRAAVRKLLAAVHAYQSCLEQEPIILDADTYANARHNLRLVERLLARKRAEAAEEPPPPPGNGDEPPGRASDPPGAQKDHRSEPPTAAPPGSKPGSAVPDKLGSPPGSVPSAATNQHSPGRGNLPPDLGQPDGPPLDEPAAREALDAHLDRIRRARSQRTPVPPGPVRHVKDW